MRKYNVVTLESAVPQKSKDLNLETGPNGFFHMI